MVEKITNIKLDILNLYLSDYLAGFHLREMSKLMKISHVTLLPHVKSLEKEKILISKEIGRNKVYSINLENIIAKNHLNLSEISGSIIFLKKNFLIKKIYDEIFNLELSGSLILFGSYAKGSFNEKSDIDLFYIGEINEKQIKDVKKISRTYGKKINIKKLNTHKFFREIRKKTPLILEIVKKHIILQNPGQFIDALWRYYNEISK